MIHMGLAHYSTLFAAGFGVPSGLYFCFVELFYNSTILDQSTLQ
jgi:hypothetical protein